MKTKFITIITSLIAACGLCNILAAPTPASAANSICGMEGIPIEVQQAAGCPGANSQDLTTIIQNIVNGVILILGIVAVIVIVIGGVSYMTSSGDSTKLQKAKNTILYACVGLVISVLSFAIVNFTINLIKGGSSSGSSDPSDPDCVIVMNPDGSTSCQE